MSTRIWRLRLALSACLLCGFAAASLGALPATAVGAGERPAVTPATPATGTSSLLVPPASGSVQLDGVDHQVLAHLPGTATHSFSMVGVTWQGLEASGLDAAGVVVRFRAKSQDTWSAWTTTTGTIDVQTTGRGGTEPLFIGASDGVEVQILAPARLPISGVKVTLLAPEQVPSDSAPQRVTMASSTTGVSAPPIITRAGWGADESLISQSCVEPRYNSSIKAVIVHHTEGSNSYTQAQAAGVVRGIYAYHVRDRGWCDIGYNALVDKYGQVFEGRHGGLLYSVHGAHAGDWNTETFGVSMMMNSNTAQPTAAGLDAMTRMIAWKLANNYVAPLGTLALAGKTINVIEGHGTVMATDCPGTNLRAYMPTLRQRVAIAMTGWESAPIHQRWSSMGGVSSQFGRPYAMEHDFAGGRRTIFNNGTMWQTPSGRVFWALDPITRVVNRTGFENTGWPTGDQGPLGWGPTGAVSMPFDKGTAYYSPTTGDQWVSGAILDWLQANPTQFRQIGLPTGPARTAVDGSVTQTFQNTTLTRTAQGQIIMASGALGDRDGDRRADILLIDTATGSLWWGKTGAGHRVSVNPSPLGRGWGSMDWISQVPDQNGDGLSELVARRNDGTLWLYRTSALTSYEPGRKIGHGWEDIRNMVVMPDMNGDGAPELVAIDAQQRLLSYRFDLSGGYLSGMRQIGQNWDGIRLTTTVGQFVGDATPDLLAVTTDGRLIAYEMRSDGTTLRATVRGTGWDGIDQILSPGDLNADGRRDLMGRNIDLGGLFGYLNNGLGGWTSTGSTLDAADYRIIA